MRTELVKKARRVRRKLGVRKAVIGTAERPRLTVYRSLKHIYAQVVDDLGGKTIACASSVQAGMAYGGNVAKAAEVGKILGRNAKAAGVERVAFDRNGFKYHGRIKALAEAAREEGLAF